ncbi:MAG TPA: DinB family protein [Mycobacteriales bacterium]|nr:DinB family protein [Mycobacteriales bacterium]
MGGEREMLNAWLDWHRATLAHKCDGLSDEQLHEHSALPSALSLLGLVRHMAEVERNWFRRVLTGEAVPLIYSPDWDFQAAYDVTGADVAEAFDTWRAECDTSRRAESSALSLDVAGSLRNGESVSLRWIMIHMIEEYARHNGHADLLRERIDGVTGE